MRVRHGWTMRLSKWFVEWLNVCSFVCVCAANAAWCVRIICTPAVAWRTFPLARTCLRFINLQKCVWHIGIHHVRYIRMDWHLVTHTANYKTLINARSSEGAAQHSRNCEMRWNWFSAWEGIFVNLYNWQMQQSFPLHTSTTAWFAGGSLHKSRNKYEQSVFPSCDISLVSLIRACSANARFLLCQQLIRLALQKNHWLVMLVR